MDSLNVNALAHAQNLAIQALLATHPNPQDLNEALSHYLSELELVLGSNEKLLGATRVWVTSFRQNIRTGEPSVPE